MKHPAVPILSAALFFAASASTFASPGDYIHPPAKEAEPKITFDGRGFTVDGKRVFIASGSIHYPRVPRALWGDRLLRLSRGGFNTVETYAFWNYHEPKEGRCDFTGEKDFGAFLQTAQGLGLYAIVRAGPYVCAEWDLGGFPVWMKLKSTTPVRANNPEYLAFSDHWYEEILPIVSKHQIHTGGNVILVQLENEHPLPYFTHPVMFNLRCDAAGLSVEPGRGKGLDSKRVAELPYFAHLQKKARELGIGVPIVMNGINHGHAPFPEDPDTSKRQCPWFTTEFWPGWFNLYGKLDASKSVLVDAAQWAIMARGGAGYNFYMFHGGSNFETWNDPSGGASYDYGGAVGQAGDLRPVYFRMKRANQLAQSFQAILADGSDASDKYKDFVEGAEVVGARKSDAGTLVFVCNKGRKPCVAKFKDGTTTAMRGGETFAVPVEAEVAPGMRVSTNLRVVGVAKHGDVTTLVVCGNPGEKGVVNLDPSGRGGIHASVPAGVKRPEGDVSRRSYEIAIPNAAVTELPFRKFRILALSSALADRTWFVGKPGGQSVVVGPQFVGDFQETPAGPRMTIERPYGEPACGRVGVYADKAFFLEAKGDLSLDAKPAPALGTWEISPMAEIAPTFDDSAWMKSDQPRQMGSDGDTSAFAWYRTKITAQAAGTGTLKFKNSGRIQTFVNGKPAAAKDGAFELPLVRGENTVAIFVSHGGRDKVWGFIGPLADHDNKGVWGEAELTLAGKTTAVAGWRMKGGCGSGVARTTFDAPGVSAKTGAHPILRFDSSSLTRGTLWLNGHNLGRYPDTVPVKGIYLPECWMKEAGNSLVVFDECGASPAQAKLVVEAAASREILVVSKPADASAPIIVPSPEDENLAARNKGNLAFQCDASSDFAGDLRSSTAAAATDGDPDTLWCAPDGRVGHWLGVDLGKAADFRMVEIVWEQPARHYQYALEGSVDGKAWKFLGDQATAVPTSPDSPSQLSRIPVDAVKIRRLRLTVTGGLAKDRRASIGELRVLKEK